MVLLPLLRTCFNRLLSSASFSSWHFRQNLKNEKIEEGFDFLQKKQAVALCVEQFAPGLDVSVKGRRECERKMCDWGGGLVSRKQEARC